MPWQVELNPEWGCIHSVYSGAVTKQDTIDGTAKALSLALDDRPNLFLTELIDAELQLSIVELFSIPDEWQVLGAKRANKLALVVPDAGRIRKDMRFFENVCYNRGWQVKVFLDRQSALDWLT